MTGEDEMEQSSKPKGGSRGSVRNRCLLDDDRKAKNNERLVKPTFWRRSDANALLRASRTLERPEILKIFLGAGRVIHCLSVCLFLAAATSATAKNLQIP